MEHLSTKDRELVALGAAIGSNCVSCIEHHIPEARNAGLSESQLAEAVLLADEVRQVPAAKVLETALTIIGEAPDGNSKSATADKKTSAPCCGG